MAPERTCIVTMQKKPKNELIRIAAIKTDSGLEVKVGTNDGRGIYLMPDIKVFEEAIKKNKIVWGLKLKRKLNAEEVERLRKEFELKIKEM